MEPRIIKLPAAFSMVALVGPNDSYFRILENRFPELAITIRGNEIYVKGDEGQVKQFSELVEELIAILRGGQNLTEDMITRSVSMIKQDPAQHPAEVLTLNILSNLHRYARSRHH